jgi:anti-sigma regulatory factor (Ser/Thr protein kinase)/biotin operon repressor
MKRGEDVQQFIIASISRKAPDIVQETSKKFGISRQAVNKYIRQLINAGMVEADGKTKGRQYSLAVLINERFDYVLSDKLEEDVIWRTDIKPLLQAIPGNALHILEYAVTEMLNNAIEHSEGDEIMVSVFQNAASLMIIIDDDGVGIFKKIKRELQLEDERHAILELAKGKLTTDPKRHSGEGIFFSSRVVDRFLILSGTLSFIHVAKDQDWLLETESEDYEGTSIMLIVNPNTARTVQEVFDKYTIDKEDYGFDRTIVPVFLSRYGEENLVSRSQARRLLARFDKFKEVVLDFTGVNSIGQAFADEIFRVFSLSHPNITLRWKNANDKVLQMINRAKPEVDLNNNEPYEQLSFIDESEV